MKALIVFKDGDSRVLENVSDYGVAMAREHFIAHDYAVHLCNNDGVEIVAACDSIKYIAGFQDEE